MWVSGEHAGLAHVVQAQIQENDSIQSDAGPRVGRDAMSKSIHVTFERRQVNALFDDAALQLFLNK